MSTSAIDLSTLVPPRTGDARARRPDEMGQEEFLGLMLAQLQHQDPFEPMESGAFLGQMAQFATVSGIGDLNEAFAGLADSLGASQALQGAVLVGRDVLVDASAATLDVGAGLRGEAVLDGPAAGVVIEITDESGNVVHRVEHGQTPAGRVPIAWDGRLPDGSLAPAGRYRVFARAVSGGTTLALSTRLSARVDAVNLGGAQGLLLELAGLGTVRLSDIHRIS